MLSVNHFYFSDSLQQTLAGNQANIKLIQCNHYKPMYFTASPNRCSKESSRSFTSISLDSLTVTHRDIENPTNSKLPCKSSKF